MSIVPSLTLNNGLKMPTFGLGTWNSPPGQVEEAVKYAIEVGYRHFDCAHVYQNEHEVGDAIKAKIEDGTIKREDIFITTKLWNTFHHPNSVARACEVSLKNLQLDYIDLYLIHWPMSYKENGDNLFPIVNDEFVDGEVDFVDTWKAMENLVADGKVKSIGLSNFNKRQVERILDNCRIKPVMNQIECHPYLNQSQLKAFCESKGILITAYSPLGSPARPWAEKGEPLLIEEPTILDIAAKHKKTAGQVLLKYQVQRGNIAIPKTVTKSRILENFSIFDFDLSDEEMKAIDGMNCNRRICPESMAVNHRDHPFAKDDF